jgi:hypothetical protein
MAVNVLTCVTIQPAVVASASVKVRLVTAPQPSVAVAVPSAALISAAVGLHAKCIGSTCWRDHWWSKIRCPVTILETDVEFPQPSTAENVLV